MFQIAIPWCGPLSFRALVYKKPFIAELELNPHNVSLKMVVNKRTINNMISKKYAH